MVSAAEIPEGAARPATGRSWRTHSTADELVQKLQKAHGNRLVSVVLYGSAAVPGAKDHLSDFDILCVLADITPKDPQAAEPVFRWWREMHNPSPLLFGVEELRTSTDCFPIEFHDIKDRHTTYWVKTWLRVST